jgi:hypothetical protein
MSNFRLDEIKFFEFVATQESNHLCVGEDAEGQVALFTVSVVSGRGADPMIVSVRSEKHGLLPSLLLQSAAGEFWIGVNRNVLAISLADRSIRFQILLASLFHRFVTRDNIVLAIYETGVARIDSAGSVAWNVITDVIEDWRLDEATICVFTAEFGRQSINLSTGQLTLNDE